MTLPYTEYPGREQTWLKHRVLELYLQPWAQKLRSSAKKLWFVDCFAGPWKSDDEELRDTSISVALCELGRAMEAWRKAGLNVEAGAIFVEKDSRAYRRLEEFTLAHAPPGLDVRTLHGEFGQFVSEIEHVIGDSPALLFVDPTGWKGAAMRFIRPLARRKRRDVLVNVMFHHMNRFKDDPRAFLREQLREFFDADLPNGLSEEELIALYRTRLKDTCNLRYAADLAVPHPTKEQTKFRLVVGGHNQAIVELFRDIERRVLGKEAAAARAAALDRQRAPDQLGFFDPAPPDAVDPHYEQLHEAGLENARAAVIDGLRAGPRVFLELWPTILETNHVTLAELRTEVRGLEDDGLVVVNGRGPRERTVKDGHQLALASGTAGELP